MPSGAYSITYTDRIREASERTRELRKKKRFGLDWTWEKMFLKERKSGLNWTSLETGAAQTAARAGGRMGRRADH